MSSATTTTDAGTAAPAAAPQKTAALLSGGCLCGQVRYTAQTGRAAAMVCHCRDCQKQSGSAFSVLFALPAVDLALQGELRTYVGTADSGNTVHRRFCPECGSPVTTELPARPGLVVVKAGTLDDPTWLRPRMHLWCDSAQPWVALPADLPCLSTQPPSGG
ncbi:aldehyde-activating protein [Aquabacterium soli]|uniref:Aldehyde-activating protein n=1 Tax=Aquabacterium soli TaxID=2493092 RepID=A0A3R8T4N0_9BURK|nr:GFA family protein [Aquabacterium soli]RRS06075.1 aldehyde-activating protein [Aquabacterium soli]